MNFAKDSKSCHIYLRIACEALKPLKRTVYLALSVPLSDHSLTRQVA
jgi:hypothetical protein